MSFQQTAYSTPNFVINNSAAASQVRNNVVAPWGVANHLPSSIVLDYSTQTLTAEQLVSGALYTYLPTGPNAPIAWQLPDSSSLYRFFATRSIPGYENISNNDIYTWNVMLNGGGTGTLNIVTGTGAISGIKPLVRPIGTTGAAFTNFGIQWSITGTNTTYRVF